MKTNSRELVQAVENIEQKKMNRLESILTKVVAGGDSSAQGTSSVGLEGGGAVEGRVARVEQTVNTIQSDLQELKVGMDGVKPLLERLALFLEEGPQ
jgi:hypothetical protein